MNKIKNNITSVVNEKMCIGCGACVAACPISCIGFTEGIYVNYPSVDENICINCGLCKKICPGQSNIDRLIEGKKLEINKNIKEIKVSYSTNDNIRMKSASGGIISQLLIELLDKKIIDGAIVTIQDTENPLLNKVKIIKSSEEIIKSQGSRYSPSSNCLILKDIINSPNYSKFAFVGKPCDIEALSALENINIKVKEKIFIKISIMCHHSPTRKGLLSLLEKTNMNINDIKSINFRGNGWPGSFSVTNKDNKKFEMSYFEAWGNYLSQDENSKCMYCENPFPLNADLVIGDPWGEEYKEDNKGHSLIIIRSERGNENIRLLEKNGLIMSKKVLYEDVLRFQKNLLKRHSEFYLTSMLYKKVHGNKITIKDIRAVYKENPKNLLRYIKRIKKYKDIFNQWKYE